MSRRLRSPWTWLGVAAVLGLAIVALSSARPSASAAIGSPCGTAARPPRTYHHVIWVVMENHAYQQIIGSSSAPYLNRLAARCGSATRFSAEAHPSLPNYVAMTSGSSQGIGDDAGPSSHPLKAASIFSALGRGGWRALQESMPSSCALRDSGAYAVKHNPAAYYTNVRGACRARDVPLGTTPNLSARFTFVTPNLCHDMHDCSVSAGDAWLKRFLPKVFAGREYRAGGTAVFVTWDEDDQSSGNHIATLVIAPSVKKGAASGSPFDHYSMLRTTEELLGLRTSLGRAASAASMRGAFNL
jgi:phosphatidylinositol-3-phosphatase